MTQDAYGDGCVRLLPTLRLWREQGCIAVALQDHETCQEYRTTSDTLEGLWEALERRLTSGESPTRFKSHLNHSGKPFSKRKK